MSSDITFESVFGDPAEEEAPEGALRVATVGNYSTSSGSTLIFPGSSSATQKRYKRLYSASISSGSKVLVAKVSGTYVILDRIV